ncbi:MAG: DUF4416 family protein [Candidatus Anammoxibacter sp.]
MPQIFEVLTEFYHHKEAANLYNTILMGKICETVPVNLIIGMLSSLPGIFKTAESKLAEQYGPIDIESELIPFTFTEYYKKETGDNISRKFLSFKNLIEPEDIASIKIDTNNLETTISDEGVYNVPRIINLDPGYICNSKLILATTKDYSHRIYLQKGIFAEITLQYHSKPGSYKPQPWTFPDYQTKEYIVFFNKVRTCYFKKRNSIRKE